MTDTPQFFAAIASKDDAPQHGPRPLPLFLQILWRETEGDAALRAKVFAGLSRYQSAKRPARPPHPRVAAQTQQCRLFHFGTAAQEDGRHPVILIPSLINPPDVLDLSERQSLARWLNDQGHDVWLVDWGTPAPDERNLGLAGYVEERLMPLLAGLPRAPILVGYCLGGTLALGAAAAVQAKGVMTIAAPWQFDGFPQPDRDRIAAMWESARGLCGRLGYVPMEVLQSGFWSLDPQRTIRKYAGFADVEAGSDKEAAFMVLEDWANAGPPLTLAAAQDLFDGFYRDNLTGRGLWSVAGDLVDPGSLPCPTWSIRSSTDRIVPADAAPPLADQQTLGLGHVGMIVGGRARSLLWAPLSEWLFKVGG